MSFKQDNNDNLLAFSDHNHHQCEIDLLHKAQALCEQRAVRLTQRRRQVLEILLSTHQPMGAYEILNRLNKTEQNITPPIVYRALDFLMEQGLIHRIESANAFIHCMHPGHGCTAQFLICSKCHCVAELDTTLGNAIPPVLDEARKIGFEIGAAVIEISGLCAGCRQ